MTTIWLDHVWPSSLRGGLALLLAWAFSLLPQVPAILRCWAWRAAYAVLITAFVWTTPVTLAVRRAAVTPAPVTSHVEPLVEAEAVRPRALRVPTGLATPQPPASRPRLQQLRVAAGSLWLAFLALYVTHLGREWFLSRRLRDGQPIDVPELADLCRRFAVRPPAVRVHRSIRSPLLVGVWRPTIVLPDPPPADLSLILAHELAHLKRHDLLWNWLPTVAFALLPWHPLVWLAHRRWRLATEAAADADALAATSATVADYGRLLVAVATRPTAGVLAVAAAAESRWILKERLSAMHTLTRWNRGRLTVAGAAVAVVGMSAAVPWRVVAETPPATRPSAPTSVARGDVPEARSEATTPDAIGLPGLVVVPTATLRATGNMTVRAVNATVGQGVQETETLIVFDGSTANAELAKARAELDYQTAELTRTKQLRDQGGKSAGELELAEAQAAMARARTAEAVHGVDAARVNAPFDGTVGRCDVQPGETVAAGAPLVTLLRSGPPLVAFDLPQAEAGQVHAGSPVTVSWANGATASAAVETVAPMLDPTTHAQHVTARLTTTDARLLGGMYVAVRVGLAAAPSVTAPSTNAEIPAGATVKRVGGNLFVADGAAAQSNPFPFAVPFETGANKFLPGDKITITDVRGTAADMANGIYQVSGTYTLASHDSATLAASVTARDPAEGKGPWNAAQQVKVTKGTGTFTLIEPISIRGYPHVSFYDGSSFGAVYFGTGDTVLRKWWDHDPTDKTTGTDGR